MTYDDLKETEKDECPYCGSKNIKCQGTDAGPSNSSKVILVTGIYKCLDCNKKFHKKLKMKNIMDKQDYKELQERVKKGEVLIGIEPSVARKFFTDTNNSVIKEETGETLFVERFFVKTCFYLEFICLLAGVVTSIYALKWYSVIVIPIMLLAFLFMAGKASMGKQTIGHAILLVIICIALAYYFRDMGTSMVV